MSKQYPNPPAMAIDPSKKYTATFTTSRGEIVCELFAKEAPKTVNNFVFLARDKFYDNVPFHRVITGFMAQTGDGQNGDGTGGSKYPNLPAEFTKTPFTRGVVGMARRGDSNDSANSQFFIMFGDGSFLNGQYTVVGQVVSGMEVVDKLKKGEGQSGAVTDPDRMLKVQVGADAK